MLTTRSLGLLDHHNNLRPYKNKYSDRRCFIVGCGPTAKEFDVLRDTHTLLPINISILVSRPMESITIIRKR